MFCSRFFLSCESVFYMRLEEGLRPVLVAEGKDFIPLTMGSDLQEDYPGEVANRAIVFSSSGFTMLAHISKVSITLERNT